MRRPATATAVLGVDELTVHRLTAFTTDPAGGNPAGVVVVTDEPLPVDTMQRVAADVGDSETAFLVPGAAVHIASA
jgi:PhzF family phenazine biosynthesis protein